MLIYKIINCNTGEMYMSSYDVNVLKPYATPERMLVFENIIL